MHRLVAIAVGVIFLILTAVIVWFIYRTFVKGPPLPSLVARPLFPGSQVADSLGLNDPLFARDDPANGGLVGAGTGPVYILQLTPAKEVPPPQGVPSTANGGGSIQYDASRRVLAYGFNVSGLSSRLTQAHFHRGAPGEAGPILHPIQFTELQSGIYTAQGVWNLSPEEDRLLRQGLIYVNVHTERNPPGEIRDQLRLQ